MQITEIIVSAGRTFNHPTEQYSNFKASLGSDDDPKQVALRLQAQAETMMEAHKAQILEDIRNLEDIPMTMLAYHGKKTIKSKYLNRVARHVKADQLLQGYCYWNDGKGCAVGCTIHGDSHAAYETELGVPQVIARLEDAIFERLPFGDARKWPGEFLSVIPVGADLSLVWPRFALWLLVDEAEGVIRFAKKPKTKAAIEGVAKLYARWVETGEKPSQGDFEAARIAASAYADAAASAAAYAATYASAAYADAAAYAAADAAADADADADAARTKFWKSARKKLLALLKSAPVCASRK